jgi:hypothetical protein
MPGSWSPSNFPYLNSANHSIASKATRRYNCIAWAASETETRRRWDPDPQGIYYWPQGATRKVTLEAVVQAYQTLGFRLCFSIALEEGVDKIAIYGKTQNNVIVPTHAARQLPSGEWTSKLGDHEDIIHKALGDVNGFYGEPVAYMERRRKPVVAEPSSSPSTKI